MIILTLKALNYFCINQFEIIINVLALSDSLEYLCYGSMTTTNIITLTVWGSTSVVRI